MLGVLIAFGLLSTINAMLWAGSSTLRVIGQDYRALCWLNASDVRGEPVGAVLFMTSLALVILGTGSFESLLNYIQALLELCAALGVAGVMWLRYKSPDKPRPFKVPLYPLPPLLFLGVSAWMLYSLLKMRPAETAWSVATLGIGAVVYWLSPKESPKTEVESPKSEES